MVFKEGTVRKIMKSIFEGLLFMKSKNVMHRDMKPANLLLRNKEDYSKVIIIDFGMAEFVDSKD